jgi:hypothetical protein
MKYVRKTPQAMRSDPAVAIPPSEGLCLNQSHDTPPRRWIVEARSAAEIRFQLWMSTAISRYVTLFLSAFCVTPAYAERPVDRWNLSEIIRHLPHGKRTPTRWMHN